MTPGISCDVRLGKGLVEPVSETMVVSDQCHVEAPFFPVGFETIKAEICRLSGLRYELYSQEWVTRPKRGNSGQLGSLGGHCGRCIRTRVQRGVIGQGSGYRHAGHTLMSGVTYRAHRRNKCSYFRGELVRVFASMKLKRGP